MAKSIRRLSGFLMILLAAFSLAISIYGIAQVWRLRGPFQSNVTSTLSLFSNTLQTTLDGLDLAMQSLESTKQSIATIESTIGTLAVSIEDSTPMLDALTGMLANDLPRTIYSTQDSLESAVASARIIDRVLRALAFLSPQAYNPQTPLDLAVSNIADSLDPLPGTFSTMKDSLESTHRNVETIQTEIEKIAQDLSTIKNNLEEAQSVVKEYISVVESMQSAIHRLEVVVPRWTTDLAWLLTFIFVWLGITQLSLLLQSWQMVRK